MMTSGTNYSISTHLIMKGDAPQPTVTALLITVTTLRATVTSLSFSVTPSLVSGDAFYFPVTLTVHHLLP